MRQEAMKAELKLFIRNVTEETMNKWCDNTAQLRQSLYDIQAPNLDDSNVEILLQLEQQKKDTKLQRYCMLVRIVIEFCVIIQDCYFLFYDLFLLF